MDIKMKLLILILLTTIMTMGGLVASRTLTQAAVRHSEYAQNSVSLCKSNKQELRYRPSAESTLRVPIVKYDRLLEALEKYLEREKEVEKIEKKILHGNSYGVMRLLWYQNGLRISREGL